MSKRIMIMAGGTGGHIFPALAVAKQLSQEGWNIFWLGTHNGLESKIIPANQITIDWLPVTGMRGKNWFAKIKAFYNLISACFHAVKILKKRQPHVVLGMGGFVSAPGGLMAKMLKIPLVIHEQNRVPGTANRLLAKIANRVLEAFPNSFEKNIKAEYTGNPLREEFLNLNEQKKNNTFNLSKKILIVGGSQGAQILNQIVPKAVAQFTNIMVQHQTGSVMLEEVTNHYQSLAVDAKVNDFIDNIADAYQWADIVICRAGAMTISELSAMGKPAILIPLPNAIDDHQTLNARYLSEAGAAVLLPQKQLTVESLVKTITHAINNLDAMATASKQCARLDATIVVANCCKNEAN